MTIKSAGRSPRRRIYRRTLAIGTTFARAEKWEEQGVVDRLDHYRVTARSGQTAIIVPTEQSPMVVGTTITDRGKTNNIQLRQIGTSLQLKPKVVGEHTIDIDLKYENSELFESPR